VAYLHVGASPTEDPYIYQARDRIDPKPCGKLGLDSVNVKQKIIRNGIGLLAIGWSSELDYFAHIIQDEPAKNSARKTCLLNCWAEAKTPPRLSRGSHVSILSCLRACPTDQRYLSRMPILWDPGRTLSGRSSISSSLKAGGKDGLSRFWDRWTKSMSNQSAIPPALSRLKDYPLRDFGWFAYRGCGTIRTGGMARRVPEWSFSGSLRSSGSPWVSGGIA
jgi:hypothetical protein